MKKKIIVNVISMLAFAAIGLAAGQMFVATGKVLWQIASIVNACLCGKLLIRSVEAVIKAKRAAADN